MWHLPQFLKRLELLIKPSGFGYNTYNQAIVVKIPNQIIPYLTEYYNIGFIDIEGNVVCFSSKKFSPGTNEVEYYIKLEVVDDINYTSLFVYYVGVGSVDICGSGEPEEYVFDGAYVVNYLDTLALTSAIGPNFSNHGAALQQPICDTYAAKVTGGTTYISCSVSKSTFTLFFNCYLTSGQGYLVYFSSSNYVYVNIDGSLVAKIDETEYVVGAKLYFSACSTFSITCDGEKTYIVINGLTKLVINKTFSISEIRLGGNGSSGYSIVSYFFDLFLLSPKLPLYSYYLHNTIYDSNNFFRESGYDNSAVNGYLTHWPEVIFSGDEAILRSNGDIVNNGWKYYRPITLTNSGISFLYDYQVKLKLTTSDFGNPYNNINDNGSDLRFVSVSGSCFFDYWIESWDNAGDSYVWVSVSGIPLGNSIIRMYYGSSAASSYSNGEDTFCFFDDFSGSSLNDKWTTGGPGSLSVTNGYVYPSSFGTGGSWHGPTITADFNSSVSTYIWEVKYYWEHTGNDLGIIHLRLLDSSDATTESLYTNDSHNDRAETSLYLGDANGNFSSCYGTGVVCYDDGWHIWKGAREETDLTVWFDDVQKYNGVRSTTPVSSKFYMDFLKYSNYSSIYLRVDYVYIRNYTSLEPVAIIGEEVMLDNFLIDILLDIYGTGVLLYSVSFDNGSSWHVSNLNYDSMFTKYFGVSKEYNTVLRLNNGEETIDKDYITKVNDSNQFYVNYDVDFSAGEKKNGTNDIITDFITELPDKTGINLTPVEYIYESDLMESYLTRPVEFVWGGTLGSGIMSRPVEFCFSDILNSFFYDINIDFWFGRLSQDFYIDMSMDFVVGSKYALYKDIDVDFCLSNWKYFPHQTNIICSVENFDNRDVEVSTCKGLLMSFVSDVKVSDMLYMDFNSSVFCSVSGISPYYLFDVQTTSGSLISYSNDIYCSLLDTSNYNCEIKLNTIVIENFSIDIGDTSTGVQDLCFSVDVYDKEYGVTESGITIYMNTDTLVGNAVSNLSFSAISGGYSVSWCYDINSLSPLEYVEIIVYCVNTVNDINIVSYFLKYGKRYYYNLYHIIKHDYEKLIPMLMVAENNVDIFPSFSAETMYVRIENYKRKDLSASIFGVGLDRKELQADITALTTNFYNGGAYKVRIECKDLSGNVMDPFEFEFVIKSGGS